MQRIIKSGKIKNGKIHGTSSIIRLKKIYSEAMQRLELDEVNDIFLLITEPAVKIVDFK